MVGKLSIEPCGMNTEVGFRKYSYLKICVGDFVWRIAISPVVQRIASVEKLKGAGDLKVVLVFNIKGKITYEDEIWELGYEASRGLGSQAVSDFIQKVDRWELDD